MMFIRIPKVMFLFLGFTFLQAAEKDQAMDGLQVAEGQKKPSMDEVTTKEEDDGMGGVVQIREIGERQAGKGGALWDVPWYKQSQPKPSKGASPKEILVVVAKEGQEPDVLLTKSFAKPHPNTPVEGLSRQLSSDMEESVVSSPDVDLMPIKVDAQGRIPFGVTQEGFDQEVMKVLADGARAQRARVQAKSHSAEKYVVDVDDNDEKGRS